MFPVKADTAFCSTRLTGVVQPCCAFMEIVENQQDEASGWEPARKQFDVLLTSVGARDESSTETIHLYPVLFFRDDELTEAGRVRERSVQLGRQVQVRGGNDRYSLYEYQPAQHHPQSPSFLWLGVHTHLAAWWLLAAWRIADLVNGTRLMTDNGLTVPAASCARALLETSASIRLDVEKIADRWKECRVHHPSFEQPVPSKEFKDLNDYVMKALYAGKWEEAPPASLSLLAEPMDRPSIKTPMDRLAKVEPETTELYEVLCNVVHPSVMGHLTYLTEVVDERRGERRSRYQRDASTVSQPDGGDHLMPEYNARAVRLALRVATAALDAALHTIDDIALTTGAPDYSRTPYWRCIRTTGLGRNDACPCRSGLKVKNCAHTWGE